MVERINCGKLCGIVYCYIMLCWFIDASPGPINPCCGNTSHP